MPGIDKSITGLWFNLVMPVIVSLGFIIYIVVMGCLLLFLIRSEIVYKHRSHILQLARDQIGVNNQTYNDLTEMYDKYSYEEMERMVTKWTFNQFYPNAFDYIKYR